MTPGGDGQADFWADRSSAGRHEQGSKNSNETKRFSLSDTERLSQLRLIRSENVGPVTFHELCRYFGSAAKALEALPELSRRGGAKKPVHIISRQQVEQEWHHIQKGGARLIALGEPDYPRDLAHIHAPPPLLVMAGQASLAQKTCLAIVGSRNCSAGGI